MRYCAEDALWTAWVVGWSENGVNFFKILICSSKNNLSLHVNKSILKAFFQILTS